MKLDGKDHPWLVTEQFGKGRVVFIGSSELWRLRGFKEVYFERFWTKPNRYAAAGGRTRQNRRGVLVMGRSFPPGSTSASRRSYLARTWNRWRKERNRS